MVAPPYPPILTGPTKTKPPFTPTDSIDDFLEELAERTGALYQGGIPDKQRAAQWFVEWWRNAGTENAIGGSPKWGWGLDFEWSSVDGTAQEVGMTEAPSSDPSTISPRPSQDSSLVSNTVQQKMDSILASYVERQRETMESLSQSQKKKIAKEEVNQRRMQRQKTQDGKRSSWIRRSDR